MPCPLFLPASPIDGPVADAMPLGDVFGGRCAADVDTLVPIDKLRGCCNFGYARAVCERAAGIDVDAARFLIKSDHDGVTQVAWSTERNHHPVAVGTLQISISSQAGEEPLERQARAYVSSWMRRTGRR